MQGVRIEEGAEIATRTGGDDRQHLSREQVHDVHAVLGIVASTWNVQQCVVYSTHKRTYSHHHGPTLWGGEPKLSVLRSPS